MIESLLPFRLHRHPLLGEPAQPDGERQSDACFNPSSRSQRLNGSPARSAAACNVSRSSAVNGTSRLDARFRPVAGLPRPRFTAAATFFDNFLRPDIKSLDTIKSPDVYYGCDVQLTTPDRKSK